MSWTKRKVEAKEKLLVGLAAENNEVLQTCRRDSLPGAVPSFAALLRDFVAFVATSPSGPA